VGRAGQEIGVVVRGEVRRQETHGRDVERALREQVEDQRMSPRRARRLDPVAGPALRKTQSLGAVREGGRKSGTQVQPPRVKLREVCDEADRRASLGRGQPNDLGQQLGI
jgi:hypothetical protein